MFVCVYIYVHIIYISTVLPICMHAYIHACLPTSINTYRFVYLCMSTYMYIYMLDSYMPVYMHVSHRGVFRTIKSPVHALDTSSSMTEPTINSTLFNFY